MMVSLDAGESTIEPIPTFGREERPEDKILARGQELIEARGVLNGLYETRKIDSDVRERFIYLLSAAELNLLGSKLNKASEDMLNLKIGEYESGMMERYNEKHIITGKH